MTLRDRLTLALVYALCCVIRVAHWVVEKLIGKDDSDA